MATGPRDDRDTDSDSGSSSGGNDEPSIECEDDRCSGGMSPVWHCVDCDSSYCEYVHTILRSGSRIACHDMD